MCTAREHEGMKADDVAWAGLPFVGYQHSYEEGETEPTLELRNCVVCESTLVRERRDLQLHEMRCEGVERDEQASSVAESA